MWELAGRMRGDILAEMASQPLDVLVVGGGITGVGATLDAALRGLRVGLVERDDFACGTSSRSSKMVHGGLRYLATGDVGLVREALRERRSIQQRAAHLVRPLPMLLPVYGWKIPLQRMKIGTGLWMYDLLGAWRAGVRHSWLDLSATTRAVPNIDTQGLVGGLTYQDAQADDVRLVLAVLRTALHHGAMLCNGAEAVQLLEEGDRIVGARVASDCLPLPAGEAGGTGTIDLEAKVVINASGVWADRLYAQVGHDPGFALLPSKGIHLTVRRDRIGIETGVAFFSQTGNSNVFVEPWAEDLAFIGTTDTPYDGDIARPRAEPAEVDWLLGAVNQFLRDPLGRSDVLAAWAGLRPLVHDGGKVSKRRSKDVSRKHKVVVTPGLVSLVGGKLTTYRAMAQDGIDAAVCQLGRPADTCTTHKVPLEGSSLVSSAPAVDELSRELGVDRAVARHLLRRYGAQCEEIGRLCAERPEWREQLHPDRPYIVAEAVYACRYEMARDAEDIVHRRTRLGLETGDRGEAALDAIEQVLAEHGVGAALS